uniref:Uncharacterized protein n=1 Tax=viral metagenome TaxID=1070528 RepID=A0A6H1ZJ38_9ZZZZ
MKILIALCLIAVPAFAVTPAQIDAQRTVLAGEQAKLDSLLSLQLADQLQASLVDADSTLSVHSVRVLVDAKPFDPQYVTVDVPYSQWPATVQGLWNLGLQFAPQHVPVAAGRYAVRQDRVAGFLSATKQFLQSL